MRIGGTWFLYFSKNQSVPDFIKYFVLENSCKKVREFGSLDILLILSHIQPTQQTSFQRNYEGQNIYETIRFDLFIY